MENSLISIIIPCYNDAFYIEQALNSALNQTYANLEVIVVDDGSDALTKNVLKNLKHKMSKLITQDNKGQSSARNRGIFEAKGEYILVLDSDDYFESTFCEKAITVLANKKEVKIVTCQANLLFEDGTTSLYTPSGGKLEDFLLFNNALGTSLFRKNEWEVCGKYDENMRMGYEDWEFFIRLLKNGGEAVVIQEPLYNYRKRQNSTTSGANLIKYQLLEYIYSKHNELYKDNFKSFISHLLSRIEREEQEKIKNTQRLDFKIGKTILKPFRIIKSILK